MGTFARWVKSRLRHHPLLFRWARNTRRRWKVVRSAILPSNYWDQSVAEVETGGPRGWLDSEFVEVEYIRPQISGDKQVDYLQHFIVQHLPHRPVPKGLSLGCGGGNLERALIALDAAQHMDAYDASPESIRLAEHLAAEAGISQRIQYGVRDIDQLQLPADTYDFVVIKMALHHFENLEQIYQDIHQSLRPGGVFMFNEFVGPTRFQWTDTQLRQVNELLQNLPEAHRTVPFIDRPTLAQMLAEDPTESVRSAEILPLLDNYFDVVEHKPYGGTLLNLLLTETLSTFDVEDEAHRQLLFRLFETERRRIARGELPSDFAYLVAKARQIPPGTDFDKTP